MKIYLTLMLVLSIVAMVWFATRGSYYIAVAEFALTLFNCWALRRRIRWERENLLDRFESHDE